MFMLNQFIRQFLAEHTPPSPSPQQEDGTANSAFFLRLPLEIRLLILVEAFGDRTLHVDYFDPPPTSSIAAVLLGPFRRARPLSGWHAVVCDSVPPGKSSSESLWKTGGRKDVCPAERCMARTCRVTASDPRARRARVGAVGWLRTSRRAFFEGVEVLYGTNHFHILPPRVAGTIPSRLAAATSPRLSPLLLPRSPLLATVTSLQLAWELGRVARPPAPPTWWLYDPDAERGWHAFTTLLEGLPAAFPHLRRLHLSLRGEWFPPGAARAKLLRAFERDLLAPVDEMVEAMLGPHRKKSSLLLPPEIVVAMPVPYCYARVGRQWRNGTVDFVDRIWRSLGPSSSSSSSSSSNNNNKSTTTTTVPAVGGAAASSREETQRGGSGREGGEEGGGMGYWVTNVPDVCGSSFTHTMPELLRIISQRSTARTAETTRKAAASAAFTRQQQQQQAALAYAQQQQEGYMTDFLDDVLYPSDDVLADAYALVGFGLWLAAD